MRIDGSLVHRLLAVGAVAALLAVSGSLVFGPGDDTSTIGSASIIYVAETPRVLTVHETVVEPSLTGREIVVGPAGDVASIREALMLAEDGDRIRVQPGTYAEGPLTIDRSVELIGDGRPVLDGEHQEGIILVTAPDVTIRGFEVRNTGSSFVHDYTGIRVEAANCRIEDNRLQDTFFGIFLARAEGCEVRGNRLAASGTREASSGNGIHLWNVTDVVVEDNEITGHRDGIYLEFASRARIRGNVSSGNLRYGLHFMFSDESEYLNNTFSDNAAGVAVMYSRQVTMSGNRFEHNWGTSAYGLLLKDVADSRIEQNIFRHNTAAILADGTDRLTFARNRIERNGWAVKIQASSQDNLFTENDFVDNTFDVVTNSRRSFNTFDRNHWSRYRGYDLAGDGIGDQPFRPVRLFSFLVENEPISVVLLRSFFVDLLDMAERVLPVLTPETLIDENPLMREVNA